MVGGGGPVVGWPLFIEVPHRPRHDGDAEDVAADVLGVRPEHSLFSDFNNATWPKADGEPDVIQARAEVPGAETNEARSARLGCRELKVSVTGRDLLL